jgi:hypothetical protein
MRILLLAVACLVAALTLACGGDSSDEDKVEAVVRSYFDHYIDSQIADIYPLLDATSQQACPEDQFVSVMSEIRGSLQEAEIEFVEVSEVVIEGDEARVTSELKLDDTADEVENTLIKEGGDWRIQLRPEVCQG